MTINWEKVELFMQGVFFRVSFLVFFCLFIGVFVYAYYTEQQLEEMGESAPFSTQAVVIDDSIETDAIGKAHRTRKEMQVWIVDFASELLNIDAGNKAALMREVRPYFTDTAFKQYQQYLAGDNIMANIDARAIKMGAIIDQTPQLLNSGLIGGKYRWLFDVPAIVTLTPVNPGPHARPDNRKIMIRMQLGRAGDDSNPQKIIIESWTVQPRR